jgi:nucleoside-diphosphate kinase
MERTLIIFKPDAVQRGLCGEILSRFERKGIQVVGAKLMKIPTTTAETHYEPHKGKGFYAGLVKFMTSSPVLVLALQGKDVITIAREDDGRDVRIEGRARHDPRRLRRFEQL